MNENCTRESTCVRDAGGAFYEKRDLQGCGVNEDCKPVDGVRQCTCSTGFIRQDGNCQS